MLCRWRRFRPQARAFPAIPLLLSVSGAVVGLSGDRSDTCTEATRGDWRPLSADVEGNALLVRASSDEAAAKGLRDSALSIAVWECAGGIRTVARIELADVLAVAPAASSEWFLSTRGRLSGTFLHDGALAVLLGDFNVVVVVRNAGTSLHALPFEPVTGSALAGVGRGGERRLLLAGHSADPVGTVLMSGSVQTPGEQVEVKWHIDSRSVGSKDSARAAFGSDDSHLVTIPTTFALAGEILHCKVVGARMHVDRTPTQLGAAVLRARPSNGSHVWECVGRFEEGAEPSIGEKGYVSVTERSSHLEALKLHEWDGAVHELTARALEFGKLDYQRFVLCDDFLLVAGARRVGRLRVP